MLPESVRKENIDVVKETHLRTFNVKELPSSERSA